MGVRLPNSRYEELKEIGADIIEDADISEYPFDVFAVADKLDIKVIAYQSLPEKAAKRCFDASEDGFSGLFTIDGRSEWRIYYNAAMSEERIRFTIMHEIGHISADHMDGNEVEESEANFLASFVLAPPCIIHKTTVEDYIDLANEFDVSLDMAYYHIDSYNKWLRFSGPNYTEYEKRILAVYEAGLLLNHSFHESA
ncbi:ImmA/IrrE family metallo-endopeptidase [Lacticaseibacillus hegangensis]|uniref:ImmA/IrrE family metallo-endopeptidase n=1 Tax=Lacticaseibacillus hegangensis TaxID=2486010 RepID=A0ABW4CVU9_9LACO|nr:ImmA/IrrE family metallo-endopeptidase [Lacticaseibacillus hegangensis]